MPRDRLAHPARSDRQTRLARVECAGAGYNVLPVRKQRLNAKTLVTTPNSDVIYAMGYVDLVKDGPLVIELPPGQQGILVRAPRPNPPPYRSS
jgi:hypothetical protein